MQGLFISFFLDLSCTWRETYAKPHLSERTPANQDTCLSVWTYWLYIWVALHHWYWVHTDTYMHTYSHTQIKDTPLHVSVKPFIKFQLNRKILVFLQNSQIWFMLVRNPINPLLSLFLILYPLDLSPILSLEDVLCSLRGVIQRRHPSATQSRQLKHTLPTMSVVLELLSSQVTRTKRNIFLINYQ